jgi:hypothetical protein
MDLKGVKLGEYQGKPIVCFGEGNGFPFSFGSTKAKHILQAIADNGADAVVDTLKTLVALKDEAWVKERFGEQQQIVAPERVITVPEPVTVPEPIARKKKKTKPEPVAEPVMESVAEPPKSFTDMVA